MYAPDPPTATTGKSGSPYPVIMMSVPPWAGPCAGVTARIVIPSSVTGAGCGTGDDAGGSAGAVEPGPTGEVAGGPTGGGPGAAAGPPSCGGAGGAAGP